MLKKKVFIVVFTIIFIVVLNNNFCFALGDNNSSKITVLVNDNSIKGDTNSFIKNGRVMAQVRALLEAFEVSVSWNDSTKSVIGKKDGLNIRIPVNSKVIYKNNDAIEMDTEIVLSNGKTYGSVRYIANLFDADILWNNIDKTVNIQYENKNQNSTDYQEIVNSNYNDEFIKLAIKDSDCVISGKVKDIKQKKYLLINFINDNNNKEYLETIVEVNENGVFEKTFNSSDLVKGRYKLHLYTSSEKYNEAYKGFIYDEDIVIIKNNNLSIENVKTYELNKKAFLKNDDNPNEYLDISGYSENNYKKITNLSKEITSGISSDYEKILAIHDWVAENIYYDYDAYNNHNLTLDQVSAINVLNSKKSVCQGYANLFQALCRAIGIPCYIESGYALGVSSNDKKWSDIDLNNINSNHAWNIAFADNRWIIIDTTWDSSNEYKNNKFIKNGSRGYKFFDSTLLFFSRSHYIMN